MSDFTVREEQLADRPGIRAVLLSAFGGSMEADLVDRLRKHCAERVSLVAVTNDVLVGYLLFTPAEIQTSRGTIKGWALGPMAVLPEYQRRGIGSQLLRRGVEALCERKALFIVVLGHPEYYPRFGFEAASRWHLRAEWDVPDDAFMILALEPDLLTRVSGIVRYRGEFRDASPPETSGSSQNH